MIPYLDQVSLNNTNQTNISVMVCHYNTKLNQNQYYSDSPFFILVTD